MLASLGRFIHYHRARRHFVELAALILTVAASRADAALILNFNDGSNGGFVGNFHAGSGVTFSANTQWSNFASPDEAAIGAGGLKITDIAGANYRPKINTPLVATFSTPISAFSIRGVNVGGNGARIEAYDAAVGGNLVAFNEVIGSGLGDSNHPLLSLTASPSTSIRRVHLYQPLSVLTEGVLFDNLSFTPIVVPEPATAILMLIFLLGATGGRWKRQPADG